VTIIREPGVPGQDAAEGVVAEMWEQVLDQIPDEDRPVALHDVDAVGHLFDGDDTEVVRHNDVTAWDDHDVDDLTAEEAAMHYVESDDEDLEGDPELTPEVRRELEEF
jgi:hypothetical protein